MFNNVLVGVDGATHGRDAIALARRLRDPAGRLTLVHVHWRRLWSGRPITAAYLEAETAYSWRLLEREREVAGTNAALASVVALGVGRGLHLEAERQQADLIVVGSCGRGFVGRAAVGDDTRAAINGATCAVAVAPHDYARTPRALGRVGLGYNDTPESDAALAVAREIAARAHAKISALEVVATPALAYDFYAADLSTYVQAELEAARERLEAFDDVDGHTVHGVPGEELARFSGDVDLLVVGSRGYGPLRRVIFGSTSNYLARHARSALLVLPRPAVGSEQPLAAASAGG
jgi:nucleotide-binding universal stress UspA family protein